MYRSRRAWPRALLVVALAWGITPSARAAATAEERAVAADLFQRAVAAQDAADWAACERALSDAVAIVETPGLLFHLAYCKEQQKRWVEALVHYRRAQEMMQQGVQAKDVAALLPEAMARLESEIPRLTLQLSPVPEATELSVDDDALSPQLFGKPLPLDPGNRHIRVQAPGYEPFHAELSLLPRERRTLDVVLVQREPPAKPKPAAVPPRAAERSQPWLSPKGWVMLSEATVSAAALGLGIVFSAEAGRREDDRRGLVSNIDDPTGCAGSDPDYRCGKLQEAIRGADNATTYATAAYVTSAVGVTALLGTWRLWPESDASAVGVASDGVSTIVSLTRPF
jgi:hypothetical protein